MRNWSICVRIIGMRSKFLICRRDTLAQGVRFGRYSVYGTNQVFVYPFDSCPS